MPIRRITPIEPARTEQPAGAGGDLSKPHYQVGYGKPPVATRFTKGVSGNPKGRPRFAKSLDTIVREVMLEKVPIRTAGGEKRVSRAEALVMKQLELASKGNVRALLQLLQLFRVAVPEQATAIGGSADIESTETDRAILDALQTQLLAQAADSAIAEEA